MSEKETEIVETEEPEIKEEAIEEKPDDIKVEGKNIVINGEEYDPEKALDLIKKLRTTERDHGKLTKKLTALEEAEQKRKEAEMTETEKLKSRAETAESKLNELEKKEKKRVAAEKAGLPIEFADRLQGETPEELEADAKILAEKLPKKSDVKIMSTTPGENATNRSKTDYEQLQDIYSGNTSHIFSKDGLAERGGGVFYSPGKQSGFVERPVTKTEE